MENPDSKITTYAPQQEEPEHKKPRMSTTTSDDEETALGDTTATKKLRYKRRKIAIFFAYCGVGYQGMQKNPGAKTIEGDLEEALFQSGAVPEHDRGIPKRYDWARSARTDKGVSAVGQVVSGRFYIDPPGLVERLNSNLSSQIRIFGYKRVTGSFNAKKFCDRRRYVYLIPVFALDPSSHRDRESVLASLGSGNELVKCWECSERGRKVIGAVGNRSFESKSFVSHTSISSNDGDAIVKSEIKEDTSVTADNAADDGDNINAEFAEEAKVSENNCAQTQSAIPKSRILLNNIGANTKPDTTEELMVPVDHADDVNAKSERLGDDLKVGEEKVDGEEQVMEGSVFCYGEKEKERFNRILSYYVGSHNFHNFTTRTKAEDPAARRYIISFDAKTTVTVEGIEFVKCEVVGQSFMLHQIRKMIGVAVAIMRNCAPESLISTALQKDVNINVPTAPEVGLYLDECFFTSYNQKWKDSHEELSMKVYEEVAEDFKVTYIYSHIASTEHKEGTVALWLHSLNHRNYPDLLPKNYGDTNGEKCMEM
ncbi:hypothetical protein JCGZ_08148 [Jatropha curcas]|uniref:Pseudouridine synthase I TruA alpha/beta domain-containing protein n=1 Tax=Jatropha curcas TaxID=180498 RepID=A0A067KL56_JATCU|nr:tRNA pseudouridine synthase A [Jatropha curcas]KDP36857.1 hypothetical protein JCGZ_08148 [Jatropha curcas]